MRLRAYLPILFLIVTCVLCASATAAPPKPDDVRTAIDRACTYYYTHCNKHGGYVWRYSKDLTLSEGEAETGPDTVWVQPPGTPTVGMAYIDAYDATGDPKYLVWATEAAEALVSGQLQSGGWYYSIHFNPTERTKWGYRDNTSFKASSKKKNKTNITTLDDDTTPAALRCLMKVDQRLGMKNQAIHDAAMFALEALLIAQYPNGGWYQNWDNFPTKSNADEFPVVPASYPNEWSRKWLNDWPGHYYTNDNVTGMMTDTLLLAAKTYDDDRYLEAAKRTGDFLILAQMPDPQPAWAQQYNPQMHPCWDRKMEPPAISSHESEEIIVALMQLYRETGEERFLKPIPQALAYLKMSHLPNGQLARFYELKTNKPLFMDDKYNLTYAYKDAPSHYGWVFDSHVSELQQEYNLLKRTKGKRSLSDAEPGIDQVQKVLASLDEEGRWIDARGMRGYRKASQEGVLQSETFAANIQLLSGYLTTTQSNR